MSGRRNKVVVAMSGGVDSSVAACLLVEQGYEVVGLFMRVGVSEPVPAATGAATAARPHQGCCSASDAADARFVAGLLGIPFYVLNFQADFEGLIRQFADEYAAGRTPNPCVHCNDKLKFGRLVQYADAVAADYVATGHYARLERSGVGIRMLRGRDARKDQSYVLFGVKPAVLPRVLFPVGELTKAEVREVARRRGLPNCDKPDSVEICFVPDRDYARVVRERRPEAFTTGDVIDEAGRKVGEHKGLPHYTIGQRRGLRIAMGVPIYVTELRTEDNTVRVGDSDALLRKALIADRVNYLAEPPECPFRAQVKVRYLHTAADATVHPLGADSVRVVFDEPQRAIAPGQAAVFYDGDAVLGGGWIRCAESAPPNRPDESAPRSASVDGTCDQVDFMAATTV